MLLHFVLAVFLSQAVAAGDATSTVKPFEAVFPSVVYEYPESTR